MNKSPVWMKWALVAGVLAALVVTSAASFFMPSVNTRNGIVVSYVQGKTITIRGAGSVLYDYNLTSSTQVLPDSMSSGLNAGAQVTVYGQCFKTIATSGCIALNIWVRTPASGSSGASSSAPAASPSASPSAPAATPTP